MAHIITPEDKRDMNGMLRKSRKAFQQLLKCASIASMAIIKYGESPTSSREITPLVHEKDDFEEIAVDAERFPTEPPDKNPSSLTSRFTDDLGRQYYLTD
ncbi:hypothetical protein MMC14_008048, partial [Varicellaria rhodocarpa]|nr:hypothetical protein [Varicellaria rhodocarpa]